MGLYLSARETQGLQLRVKKHEQTWAPGFDVAASLCDQTPEVHQHRLAPQTEQQKCFPAAL